MPELINVAAENITTLAPESTKLIDNSVTNEFDISIDATTINLNKAENNSTKTPSLSPAAKILSAITTDTIKNNNEEDSSNNEKNSIIKKDQQNELESFSNMTVNSLKKKMPATTPVTITNDLRSFRCKLDNCENSSGLSFDVRIENPSVICHQRCYIMTVHDIGYDRNQFNDFINCQQMDEIRNRVVWLQVNLPGQGGGTDLNELSDCKKIPKYGTVG